MSVLQHIKVYVINLDRRPDRWEMAQRTLRRAGFVDIERISAVDGKMIDSNQVKKLIDPSVFNDLGKVRKNHEDLGSLGAVGCYLSHYKAWNQIYSDGKPAIVVEDDLLCHPLLGDFNVAKDTTTLRTYDFVLLASVLREENLVPPSTASQGIYPYHGMFFLTHFYFLTPNGAKYFINNALPMKYQVDSYMSFKIRDDKKFRSAVHIPNLANQSDSTTDIQTPMKTSEKLMKYANSPHKIMIITITVLICIMIIMMFCKLLNLIHQPSA